MFDDPYDLPEDPEEAFLQLEAHYREELSAELRQIHESDGPIAYTHYIAKVLGAIIELGLEGEATTQQLPAVADTTYNTYVEFAKDIEHYKSRLKIRRARRIQGYSVKFDQTAKSKIHHHIKQLRTFFEKIEVSEAKRESLFNRLSDLENEVDRTRTRFETFAALAIESADLAAELVERSKIRDLLDAIARVFGATHQDQRKRLPPAREPKKIEPPKPKVVPDRSYQHQSDLADEIPF
jgi:hypothetical protein